MEIGGIGATFVNCALLIIFYVIMLVFLNVNPSGTIITVSGFSLFGKNILNIWPIIYGIWLYSRFQKEPFSNYIVTALFGTTLSPALIQLIGTTTIPLYLSVMIGILISIVIGFLLPPLASACM